jgi:hypothetical protein
MEWGQGLSRHIDSDAKYVYRAVVTREYPAHTDRWGNVHEAYSATEYCGPFSTKGHATAAIKRNQRSAERWSVNPGSPTVTGEVQRSPLYWEGVE